MSCLSEIELGVFQQNFFRTSKRVCRPSSSCESFNAKLKKKKKKKLESIDQGASSAER